MIKYISMKKILFLPLVFAFILSLFSCSKAENNDQYFQNNSTLKSLVTTKGESALWTTEIEKELLTSNLSKHDEINPHLKLSTEVFAVASAKNEKIYPYIENFGSLDLEGMSKEAYNLAEEFAKCLCSDIYSAEKLMANDSLFSFVFLIDDLEKDVFKRKIQSSEDEEGSCKFESYVIGSSFLSGQDVQVPLRLYTGTGRTCADLVLFLNEKENKIKQIKIINRE